MGAFRNFELNQMALNGVEGRCFYPEEHGVPPYDELIYVAKLDADAEKISRFLAATEEAVQYIINHPQESWEIFASYAPELNDDLNRMAWRDTLPRFAHSPAALDHGRYARLEAFLAASGLSDGKASVRDLAIDVDLSQ